MTSFYRIENIIFVSQDISVILNNKEIYTKVVVYIADPEKLKQQRNRQLIILRGKLILVYQIVCIKNTNAVKADRKDQ